MAKSRNSLKTTGVRDALRKIQLYKQIKLRPVTPVGKSSASTKGSSKGGIQTVTKASSSQKVQKPTIVSKTKLRSSIAPGTVLIILAGKYRGKRAVFLKQLESSGLLLVSGPYKLNGVPLTRINQRYVIATSTKMDFSSFKYSSSLNDDLFKKIEKKERKEFLENQMQVEGEKESGKQKIVLTKERIGLQKEVDTQLLKLIKMTPLLRDYLGSLFSLRKGQAPHSLKF